MSLIHVEVTQEDIGPQACYSPSGCMAALALTRALGKKVFVHYDYDALEARYRITPGASGMPFKASLDPFGDMRLQTLPEEVWAKIAAFDRGEAIEPFAFDLEVPDEVLQ